MSIHIPPDLRWLGWLVGVDPPLGDEDMLFTMGRAWHRAAKEIVAQVDPLTRVRQTASGSYRSGEGAQTIDALFTALLDSDSSLTDLAASFDEVGNAAFDFGTTVQAAKLMMIISYALLLAEITWAWMFPPTAPALEAAAVSGTRSSLRALEDAVVSRIEQAILKAVGAVGQRAWTKLVVKNLATYTVKASVSGGQALIIDGLVQGGQLAAGTRRHFDGNQAALSLGSSMLGGMLGRAAGHWGGIGFDASIGRLTNGLGPVAGVARGVAIGAFAGEVSTLGGAMASAMNTGDWTGAFSGSGFAASLVGGGVRGGVAGGARGLFQLNRVPTGSARTGFLRHFQLDAEGNVYVPANRLAAVGGSPREPIPKPAPVARPPGAADADPAARQRAGRAFDRHDAANLREHNRQIREAQPRLRGTPDPTAPDQSRARALGRPDADQAGDRQPPWARRMGDRAHAMHERAESTQQRADQWQARADTAQQRATVQQTRAATEHANVVQTRTASGNAEARVRSAEAEFTRVREEPTPNPQRLAATEQALARARTSHTEAAHELATARERASTHQSRADEHQTTADDLQRKADAAQTRADEVRMVRVDRDAIDRKADSEARKITQPGTDENTWWKRALMRSERIGKEYGQGGEGTDRYQSKGTDLRGKTRSK
ncbi:WXG100-like domain-containing protein, partial [Nocardia salmonicida]